MACAVTHGSGQSKGLEDALGASVKGKLQGKITTEYQIRNNCCLNDFNKIFSINESGIFFVVEVESDLPENLRDEAVLCFEAAVANKMQIGDAITKVQKDVLSKCDEIYKGQRYKGFIKFDYDTNVVTINVG